MVTERSVLVLGMTAEQFAGRGHLGLPETWFGRFKGEPGQTRDIHLDSAEWSCGSGGAVDLALEYVRRLGLTYEETRTVRHKPTPDA